MLSVELVYVPVNEPMIHLHLQVAEGTTVLEVLNASNIVSSHPETQHLSVGVFSKQVAPDTLVKTGDRIEIYRGLLLDPMEKRRQRARTVG